MSADGQERLAWIHKEAQPENGNLQFWELTDGIGPCGTAIFYPDSGVWTLERLDFDRLGVLLDLYLEANPKTGKPMSDLEKRITRLEISAHLALLAREAQGFSE